LFACGYVVVSGRCPCRDLFYKLAPDAADDAVQQHRLALLAACREPSFEILTGRAAKLVAVRCAASDLDKIAGILGRTAAVLRLADGSAVSAYRSHAFTPIISQTTVVRAPSWQVEVQIIGERSAISVPPEAYEQLNDWPPIAELPVYDARWIRLAENV
jgi:hypothetical protein